ncbi:MAG: organomercurial lyase [Candidatus Rokuibacteriota bacterium]
MTLPIKTLDELMDPAAEARQAARRAARQNDLLRQVWRALLARGAPIAIDRIEREATWLEPTTVRDGLARLDDEDLILLEDGAVRLAYPFSGDPTAFTIVLPDGRARCVCCAVDALGIAPMLGQPIDIRAHCHHCGGPIGFPVDPEGPGPGADDVMVWIGRRDPDERRACTGH